MPTRVMVPWVLVLALVAATRVDGERAQSLRAASPQEQEPAPQERAPEPDAPEELAAPADGAAEDVAKPPPKKKPPDGLLPVAEVTRLGFTPRDRPRALLYGTHLLVVSSTGFVEGHDATTGEFQWKLGLPGEALHDPVIFETSPLEGGVATSFSVLLSAPSGHVILVDGLTGEIQHETHLPFELALSPVRGPDDTVLFATPSGDIVSHDVKKETVVFRTATGERPLAVAHAQSMVVVSGASQTLTAIDLPRGTIRWTFRGRAAFHAPAAFDRDGHRVYVGDDTGEFYCLDAVSGSVKFRWSTGAAIRSGVLVEGKRVYLASFANTLFAFNGGTGDEHWRVNLPGRPAGSPMRVRNRLMVATFDGTLVEINPQRGQLGKRYAAPGEIVHPPSFFLARPSKEELAAEAAAAALEESDAEANTGASTDGDGDGEPDSALDSDIFGPPELELDTTAETDALDDEPPAADAAGELGETTETPEVVVPSEPAWFERSRIAMALRSGEVLLLFPHEARVAPSDDGSSEGELEDSPTERRRPRRRPTETGRSVPF